MNDLSCIYLSSARKNMNGLVGGSLLVKGLGPGPCHIFPLKYGPVAATANWVASRVEKKIDEWD